MAGVSRTYLQPSPAGLLTRLALAVLTKEAAKGDHEPFGLFGPHPVERVEVARGPSDVINQEHRLLERQCSPTFLINCERTLLASSSVDHGTSLIEMMPIIHFVPWIGLHQDSIVDSRI